MAKIAYPNEEFGQYIEAPHSIPKWVKGLHDIYAMTFQGEDWSKAFSQVTASWDVMEKLEFKKWVDFYEEKAHEKYKTAQLKAKYVDNGQGSFIPNIDHLKASNPFKVPTNPFSAPAIPQADMQSAADAEALRLEVIKKKVRSIVSRLNAAERLATDPDVIVTLKRTLMIDIDKWLESLSRLKREIQMAPVRVSSAILIDDIIYKNANILAAKGNRKAAHALLKIAQDAMPPLNPADATMPGQPPMAPAGAPAPVEDGGEEAIEKFLKNLNNDDSAVDDVADVDDEEVDELAAITVTAQEVPPPPPAPEPAPTPTAPADVTPGDLEVSEDDITADDEADAIERALAGVQVSDIVARLEGIASMFKTREIARQMFIIDLMMDKLGIAPFFPTLAEAMRSLLESNQYCQSRIEDILAKLRGTIVTPMSQQIEQDNAAGIKERLQQEEEAEKARKERRKQQQQAEENAMLQPAATAPEAPAAELAGPAQVETAPQAVRPG